MKKLYMFVMCAFTALMLSVPAFADLIALPPQQPEKTPNFLLPALLVLIVAVVVAALIIYKHRKKK